MIKKNIIFIFLLLLFIPTIKASSCVWEKFGGNVRGSFIQNNCDTIVTDNYTVSNQNDINSTYQPLIVDLNDDSINEIIVFNVNNEIRLYNEKTFELLDSYYNPLLTFSGQPAVTNFISSTDVNELVLITNTIGTNYSLWVINWNSTNWTISKEISISNTSRGSNGLNCLNLDSDDNIECAFFSTDGKLFMYDETNTINTTALYEGTSTSDCVDYSIPKFWDYDSDSDYDIFTVWGASCNQVLKLENNNDGTFTFNYNFTPPDTTGAVNHIKLADLDGGQRELVITNSNWYKHLSSTTSRFTYLYVYNLIDNTLKCSVDLKNTTKNSGYVTSLHTCFLDEGGTSCDYDNDGYNDIQLTLLSYANDPTYQLKYYDENCNNIGNIDLLNISTSIGGANTDSTEAFPTGVWANFDTDNEYEFLFFNDIWDRNGTKLITLFNHTLTDWYSGFNDFIVGDINNDNLNDIIIQDIQYSPPIKVYSFVYINQLPEIVNVLSNGINPICINETITYNVEFTDIEENYAKLIIDCYGNGTLSNGSYYYPTASHSCTYNELGTFNTKITLQDLNYPSDYSINYTHIVTISDSEYCNFASDDFTSISTSEIGVSGGINDWSSEIPTWLNDWGFKSTASKIFFGICIIIALILIANTEYKNAFVSIVIGFLGVISLTYLGIFPIWLVFLMFLLTTVLTFLVIFKMSNGST